MACGTGKTFTSLRIAENETNGKGFILFLVPSIALLGQTLNEWSSDALEMINAVCICSDPEITKNRKQLEDIDTTSVLDLAFPASTNIKSIINQFTKFETAKNDGLTIVFSTYQSIDVIAQAQKEIAKINPIWSEFDLVICDEAHRTTGVSLKGEDTSAFTKVHDNEYIKAKKRLYMTATPRLYDNDTKSKAAKAEAVLCSMDDVKLYGEEMYRIGFGEAVEKDLLTDYKVLILTLSENDISPAIQKMITDKENEINTDDASKLIGCINALSKEILGDEGLIKDNDPEPMRRAVAFCSSIVNSIAITDTFNNHSSLYLDDLTIEKKEKMVDVASKHIDGTMNATERNELLSWLKSETKEKECRILTNVRCLSEGVDVPSLDAVLFLSARNSQVDVVQSVGRVMRKAPNKKYGYIIIPVFVPTNIEADKALDDNERFKVVWSVLNALRAHDDRFNATINKIELNKKPTSQIKIVVAQIGGETNEENDKNRSSDGTPNNERIAKEIAEQLALQFEELQSVVFARMVKKVGDRRYWEMWAKSVADIATRQTERITKLINDNPKHHKAFENFVEGLHKNINPSITNQECIEMLSQHIITKPVFDALFEDYSFVKNNPISQSMTKMLDLLEEQALEEDTLVLKKFYESVQMRASGIDNAEGKQKIIIELYDKFFKTAFPKLVEKLGIVYSPVEVVDFIIFSVNDILIKEFGRSITDENVNLLDPFTGTGTFITRLLQSGLIKKEDLLRKYTSEIYCNEIVLLAYYIAAINIENTFHDIYGGDEYLSFEGICLTDTFQLGETKDGEKLFSEMFPQNSKRVQKQQKAPLRVIFGNPPYSIGQKSADDNASNQIYPNLERRVLETYSAGTTSKNSKALYDAYIKAFRWSSDRIDKNGGIICFVSNGGWIDGNSADGFRKSLEKEFSSIYVFNLRGNQRTSGELSRKEGGKIFGSGSRTPISITLLVKNPEIKTNKATIHYHDIGDYLDRDEKLKIVSDFKSFGNDIMPLTEILTNDESDWISHRNGSFSFFDPIGDSISQSFFKTFCYGLTTNRDVWIYQFSKNKLVNLINKTTSFYNSHFDLNESINKNNVDLKIGIDSSKISWSRGLKNALVRGSKLIFNEENIRESIYRPFQKQKIYYDKFLNEYLYKFPIYFPKNNSANLIISITGVGSSKDFSCLISNKILDLQTLSNAQCFPLYYYEENTSTQKGLFDTDNSQDYIRRDAISDFILEKAKKQYGKNVSKEDIFYYVYGFLHNKDYRETFANDLKKMLPRLPLIEDVKDFWSYSKAGRKLAELHLNYEEIEPYSEVVVKGKETGNFEVDKMRFPKKDQKDTIFYNSSITITNIPEKAYEYVVNGKSAIEWIMERYQKTTHKESGITNNPNDWATETGKPTYILDLLLSIINVSIQTIDIVNDLPKVSFE